MVCGRMGEKEKMRLIDAEEFKKQIAGMAIANNYPADKANKMCELIDCQPTAYDVDKVVERLEDMRLKREEQLRACADNDMSDYFRCKMSAIAEVIEIVKSGGIKWNR